MGCNPTAMPVAPLTDGVVRLRLPHGGDVATVYAYGQDPDIARTHWLPLCEPCSREGAACLIRAFQQGWQGHFGLTWVITLPPADDLRGVVHLSVDDAGGGEIAYGVAPRHRRQGLATRATRLVAAWAGTERGITRMEICVTARGTQGVASRCVAENAGFVYAGTRHSFVPATGAQYDDDLYILTVSGMG